MSLNTLLHDEKISRAEDITSFPFNDRFWLQQALRLPDNRDLALLGDALVKLAIIREGRRRHATRNEIGTVVSRMASNDYLAQRGFSTGLDECVYKNRSQGSTIFPGPMATTVEAIIGAVFNDSGESLTTVEHVMQALGISWPE